MATRLATTRNFITVTSVTNDDSDANTSISNSNTTSTVSDGQRTTQITPVALHHVNLSQVSKVKQNPQLLHLPYVTFHPTEENYPSNGAIGKRQCH